MSATAPAAPHAAEDACPLCGYWRCRCTEVLRIARRLAARITAA